jgi:CHAD domain-containing protein
LPESVHDLRVETRRLAAYLELLGAVHACPPIAKARHCLKKQMDASGALSDAHVHLELLSQIPDAVLDRKAVGRKLGTVARRSAREFARVLQRGRLERHQEALKEFVRSLPDVGNGGRRLGFRLKRLADRRFETMVRLQRQARLYPARLHPARIALKKFRYLAELLLALGLLASTAELDRLRDCQRKMGKIHDLDLFIAYLSGLPAKSPAKPRRPSSAVLGRLVRQRRTLQAAFRAEAKALFFRSRSLSRLRAEFKCPGGA